MCKVRYGDKCKKRFLIFHKIPSGYMDKITVANDADGWV